MTLICVLVAVLAMIPAGLTLWNLSLYRSPPPPQRRYAVSVIVPARNEESGIGDCVAALALSQGVDLEVIVVDDQSTDRTGAVVQQYVQNDRRIRIVQTPSLPPGWSGKPHACLVGVAEARHPVLLFLDADVRVSPKAVGRMAEFMIERRLGLASGFPRQLAHSFGEKLLVPLIHVLLLGYLPIFGMRRSLSAGFGAGCGQLIVVDAVAYKTVGGHGATRRSWHEGVTLPRAFRNSGFATDLFDATGLATCRMYNGFAASWRGFSKNATEGMATPAGLPIWTVLLLGGFVSPWLVLAAAAIGSKANVVEAGLVAAAYGMLLLARTAVAWRFRQGWLSVVLTPVAILALLALQWSALLGQLRGRPQSWRGRTQVST